MGSLHWLVLIPFYFLTAPTLLLLAMLGARMLRLRVSINPIVCGSSSPHVLR